MNVKGFDFEIEVVQSKNEEGQLKEFLIKVKAFNSLAFFKKYNFSKGLKLIRKAITEEIVKSYNLSVDVLAKAISYNEKEIFLTGLAVPK